MCQSFNIFYACSATAKVVCPAADIHLKTISKYRNWRESDATCFWYLHDMKRHWNLQSFYKNTSHSCYQLNTSPPPTTNATLNPTLPYPWNFNPVTRTYLCNTLTLCRITEIYPNYTCDIQNKRNSWSRNLKTAYFALSITWVKCKGPTDTKPYNWRVYYIDFRTMWL
jgi:hypothetical protein